MEKIPSKSYLSFRLDYRATRDNQNAILSVKHQWKKVKNSNVVTVEFAFTTTNFFDHSLIIVSDYHPAAQTVADKHFSPFSRSNRNTNGPLPEKILWSYIVQTANALRAIHVQDLAARIIDPTKVLVTDEDRIRLNGCALKDMLDDRIHDKGDLQRQDFIEMGKFIIALGTNNISRSSSRAKGSEIFTQNYKQSPRLGQMMGVIDWLLDHDRPDNNEGIDSLLGLINTDIMDSFDASLRLDDQLQFNLNRELENSRIVRLMTKLNCLNERPEYERDRSWSNQGSRAILPLFRDFVFHQVSAQGNPVVDMGHILSCLNKLDVGAEERITLVTRDEQSVIVVSYKELKTSFEGAWQELMRRSTG